MGCNVLGMTAIFTYNFTIAKERFDEAKVNLHTLTDYHSLIEEAITQGYIQKQEQDTLNKWSQNPQLWAQQFE